MSPCEKMCQKKKKNREETRNGYWGALTRSVIQFNLKYFIKFCLHLCHALDLNTIRTFCPTTFCHISRKCEAVSETGK